MKLLLLLLLQNIECGKLKVSGAEDNFVDQIVQLRDHKSYIQFSSQAESELEHLREVFDKISDDITNSTEKENFEIYAKTLGIDLRIPVRHQNNRTHALTEPDIGPVSDSNPNLTQIELLNNCC